jgi:hypothetical protein
LNRTEASEEKRSTKDSAARTLKGWQPIAAFLGEPTSVVQRWASDGMPVRKQGRHVETTPEQLNAWLGKESGKPVHVDTENTDLTAELKRGLSFVRAEKNADKKQSKKAKRR